MDTNSNALRTKEDIKREAEGLGQCSGPSPDSPDLQNTNTFTPGVNQRENGRPKSSVVQGFKNLFPHKGERSLESPGSLNDSENNLLPFNKEKKVDARYLGSLRQNIDAVRMNLSAELAELRQRRQTYQEKIVSIVQLGMTVYTIFSTAKTLLLMLRKGEEGRRNRQELFKGLAMQAGLFAAAKMWEHLQKNAPVEEQKHEPMRLITDQKGAFY